MKKVLGFSGSSSSKSINQKLVLLAAKKFGDLSVDTIDIRDYPLPIFSDDIEKQEGFPENAVRLKQMFSSYDGFIISCPEYNGSMPGIFKNMIDWLSRLEGKIFSEKPVLLMSTSPGKNGGRTNIATLQTLLPWWGGNVVATFSLGSFHDEYDSELSELKDVNLRRELDGHVEVLQQAL